VYLITGDEHYGHRNVIGFDNRPFATINDHDAELIRRHNEVVGPEDTVIHAGDFTLAGPQFALRVIDALNGKHIFLKGSHDKWLKKYHDEQPHEILELNIEGQHVVICHYAMRTWGKSHYGSWQLHAHSHGKLPPIGKQLDVWVGGHNYYPWSWPEIVAEMAKREENPNLVKRREHGVSNVGLAAPHPAEERP